MMRSVVSSPRWLNAPDWRNMASTSVVLPWSTCATMATFPESGASHAADCRSEAPGLRKRQDSSSASSAGSQAPIGRHPGWSARPSASTQRSAPWSCGCSVPAVCLTRYARRVSASPRRTSPQPDPHDHLYAEFFTQLPDQRLGFGLAWCDLASRQFPQSGQLRGRRRWATNSAESETSAPATTTCMAAEAIPPVCAGIPCFMTHLSDHDVDAAAASLDGWHRLSGLSAGR